MPGRAAGSLLERNQDLISFPIPGMVTRLERSDSSKRMSRKGTRSKIISLALESKRD
jgi:hypothetical protein